VGAKIPSIPWRCDELILLALWNDWENELASRLAKG
jgi:hypothetical protein